MSSGEDEIGVADGLSKDTVLFGKDGVLDSMGLVTLVIAVEQAIEDRFDRVRRPRGRESDVPGQSPYRSVETLADYAVSQLKED